MIFFESIGSTTVPELHEKICTTCRLQVTRQQSNRSFQLMEVVENGDEVYVEEVQMVGNISEHDFQNMTEILSRLGIRNVSRRELRRETFRCEMLKQAVNAIRQILKVDCQVYYDDTNVPVVKDILDNCKIASKPVKFQILTLLTPSWSRQKMMDETGCSKYGKSHQHSEANFPQFCR